MFTGAQNIAQYQAGLPQGVRHFLDINHFSKQELEILVDASINLQKTRQNCQYSAAFSGKTLVMIFEKLSLRTRLSFEIGFQEMGGKVVFLTKNDIHLGEKETVQDTAKVISSMAHIALIRCYSHEGTLLEFAKNSSISLINGLTDYSHPCQIIAALACFKKHFGEGYLAKNFVWVGAFNNVLLSYIQAAQILGFNLHISCPAGFGLSSNLAKQVEGCKNIKMFKTASEAAKNGDIIITDTWVSMGDKFKLEDIQKSFSSYQVNKKLMSLANEGVVFSHCLPAIRGQEVTADIIDGPSSLVLSEAEFRLHSQKAIMLYISNLLK